MIDSFFVLSAVRRAELNWSRWFPLCALYAIP